MSDFKFNHHARFFKNFNDILQLTEFIRDLHLNAKFQLMIQLTYFLKELVRIEKQYNNPYLRFC